MSRNNNFIFTSILAAFSLFSVALIWDNNFILFTVLFVLAVLMLLIEKSKQEVETFVFCAISGAIAEYIAINFGAWTYENPNFFNIPIWLPLLWGIASVFNIKVYKYFLNKYS